MTKDANSENIVGFRHVINGHTYNVSTMPKYVGCYCIGKSWLIYFNKKPCWIHRKMTRLLLGWEWKDQK